MMLTIAALVLATGIVSGVLRVTPRGAAADHGWMSEKWLAEHRATPPS